MLWLSSTLWPCSLVIGISSEETPSASDIVRKREAILHIVQCSGMDAGGLDRRTPTGVRSPGTVYKGKNELTAHKSFDLNKRTVPHINVYLL